MRIEDLDLGERWSARLVENTSLTPPEAREEVHELLLETLAPEPDLRIGQNVAVLVTGPHEFGQRQHVRLYTLASTPAEAGQGRFSVCVRRCSYLDPYSGERFPGIASNYLCDLPVGSELLLAGPVGLPFAIPADPHAPLLAVGLGTGIAPFRALLHEVFEERHWRGKVMLFHGARAGLETAYIEAITAIAAKRKHSAGFVPVEVQSPRPAWDDPADLAAAVQRHQAEVWDLLSHPDIHVYLAGQTRIGQQLDAALAEAAGSAEAWAKRKAEISDAGRWMALLY